MASVIDDILEHNRRYGADATARRLEQRPAQPLAIVTCMDARLDLPGALGLAVGDAHVLRNAGGAVTDDVIRSLTISQRRLGTREIMLVHHTDCGMQQLSDEALRAELRAAAGTPPPFAIGSFSDLDAAVRQAVLRVRDCPFLPHRDIVRGFVYDVDTHRLREVDASAASDAAAVRD